MVGTHCILQVAGKLSAVHRITFDALDSLAERGRMPPLPGVSQVLEGTPGLHQQVWVRKPVSGVANEPENKCTGKQRGSSMTGLAVSGADRIAVAPDSGWLSNSGESRLGAWSGPLPGLVRCAPIAARLREQGLFHDHQV